MNKFKVSYDSESDILYIAKEGEEEKFLEIAPGINVELNEKNEVIGFEIFKASQVLKEVVPSLNEKLAKTF